MLEEKSQDPVVHIPGPFKFLQSQEAHLSAGFCYVSSSPSRPTQGNGMDTQTVEKAGYSKQM